MRLGDRYVVMVGRGEHSVPWPTVVWPRPSRFRATTLLVAKLPILVDLAARFGFVTEGEKRESGEPAMLTYAEATTSRSWETSSLADNLQPRGGGASLL